MALDTELAADITEVLNELGRDTAYTQRVKTFNSGSGTVTVVETDYTVRTSPPYKAEEKWADGKVVHHGQTRMLLGANGLAFTPNMGDRVVVDNTKYDVLAVESISYKDALAAFVLTLALV